MEAALASIRDELDARVIELRQRGQAARGPAPARPHEVRPGDDRGGRLLLGHRELLRATSTAGRPAPRPYSLLDYFRHVPGPRAATTGSCFIDESHVTIPQIRAMYNGDRSRKQVLVDHGFRLPSALDNRPLTFEEFEAIVPQVVYVSATPGPYELEQSGGDVVEQVIRPTGLLDPTIEVRPARGQVADLLEQCQERAERRRARARHRAHQAPGRGSDATTCTSRACACATCTARSTRSSGSRSCASCARASSTCSSA